MDFKQKFINVDLEAGCRGVGVGGLVGFCCNKLNSNRIVLWSVVVTSMTQVPKISMLIIVKEHAIMNNP